MSKELARHRLEQSKEDLMAAKLLYESELYKSVNNRAYYSIFHSIKAVLAMEPIDFKRHKDVMAYFNKEYVAKEIFPRELGRKLGTLKQLREKSDYDDFYIASKAQAEEQYNTAKYTLEQVSQYLSKNNTDESKE